MRDSLVEDLFRMRIKVIHLTLIRTPNYRYRYDNPKNRSGQQAVSCGGQRTRTAQLQNVPVEEEVAGMSETHAREARMGRTSSSPPSAREAVYVNQTV